MLYVDPLGNKIDLNSKLTSNLPIGTKHSYSNKINNLRKNNVLTDARLEDIEKKFTSNKINFIIYSVFACIFIIMFLFILRKLNK